MSTNVPADLADTEERALTTWTNTRALVPLDTREHFVKRVYQANLYSCLFSCMKCYMCNLVNWH